MDRKYLIKRGKGTFHLFMKIPKDARHAFGNRTFITRSLKTKLVSEAQERRDIELGELRKQFSMAKVGSIAAEATIWRPRLKTDAGRDEFVDRVEVVKKRQGEPAAEELVNRTFGLFTSLDHKEADWFRLHAYVDRTQAKHKHILKTFTEFLAVEQIEACIETVTASVVKKYRMHLIERGVHRATAVGFIASLRARWQFWVDHDVCETNPWIGVKLPRSHAGTEQSRRPWSFDELTQILEAPQKEELRNIVKLLIVTGCRKAEISNLKAGDVSQTDGRYWIQIRSGKSKNAVRDIPLPTMMTNLMAKLLAGKAPGDRLFKMQPVRLTIVFGRLTRSIGLTDGRAVLHSTRHSFVTTANNVEDLPRSWLQAVIGHARGSVTDGYAKVTNTSKIKVVEAVVAQMPEKLKTILETTI